MRTICFDWPAKKNTRQVTYTEFQQFMKDTKWTRKSTLKVSSIWGRKLGDWLGKIGDQDVYLLSGNGDGY